MNTINTGHTNSINIDSKNLHWEKGNGLIPAIVQHADTGKVLMLAYMNEAAFNKSLSTGKVTFYSRSRSQLWQKGETSGNTLQLIDIQVDCDQDTILVQARPSGPVCHLLTPTCFGDQNWPTHGFLGELERLIQARKNADPESSYTAQLLTGPRKRAAQKVGEEGVETALAAVLDDREELTNEAADLLYHLLVLLTHSGLDLGDINRVLEQRHQQQSSE